MRGGLVSLLLQCSVLPCISLLDFCSSQVVLVMVTACMGYILASLPPTLQTETFSFSLSIYLFHGVQFAHEGVPGWRCDGDGLLGLQLHLPQCGRICLPLLLLAVVLTSGIGIQVYQVGWHAPHFPCCCSPLHLPHCLHWQMPPNLYISCALVGCHLVRAAGVFLYGSELSHVSSHSILSISTPVRVFPCSSTNIMIILSPTTFVISFCISWLNSARLHGCLRLMSRPQKGW